MSVRKSRIDNGCSAIMIRGNATHTIAAPIRVTQKIVSTKVKMMNLICKVRGHNDDGSDMYPRHVRKPGWSGIEVWRCSRCRAEFQRTKRDTGLFTRYTAAPGPKSGRVDEDAFFPSTSWRMPESMPEATRTPVFESGGGGDFGGGGAESSWEPESTKVVESAPAEVETCSRSSYTSESSYSSSDSSSSDSGSSSSSSD